MAMCWHGEWYYSSEPENKQNLIVIDRDRYRAQVMQFKFSVQVQLGYRVPVQLRFRVHVQIRFR